MCDKMYMEMASRTLMNTGGYTDIPFWFVLSVVILILGLVIILLLILLLKNKRFPAEDEIPREPDRNMPPEAEVDGADVYEQYVDQTTPVDVEGDIREETKKGDQKI